MEFDPHTALAQAMAVFWANGYEATSTTDLMSAMGLSKSSLYQTFGSKQQLFTQCLDHYAKQAAEHMRTELADAKSGKQFLINLFHGVIDPGRQPEKLRGCFLVNTACEFGDNDKKIGPLLKSKVERNRQVLQEAIEQGQRAGEIPKHKDAKYLSSFLMTSLCGLRVMGKLNTDDAALVPVIDQILQQLD